LSSGAWTSAIRATAAAGLSALLVACNGGDVRPPVPPPELVPQLAGAEEALRRSARDDHWTERYGDYMQPAELRAYLATPPAERFPRFGGRLLEFALREELLQAHRLELTLEQVEAYRSRPDYDQGRRYLERELGVPVENP
jgi:hypothetical protein